MDVQGTTANQRMMQVVFRTDASLQIGTGHVMRCLTLADALCERGAQCRFICRPHKGHLLDLIVRRGHEAIELPAGDKNYQGAADPEHAAWLGVDWTTDAEQTRQSLGHQSVDWLIVDHYALDRRWELSMRQLCDKLMVIDDLADRLHDCDLLLDQNLGRTAADYSGLLPVSTTTLIGPQYALLRPEFAQWRTYSLQRREQPQLKHLLITMGGVDKDNVTSQVLDALKFCDLPQNLRITVVMGPHAPWLAQVQAQAAECPLTTQVLVGTNNMADLMANNDLAIGAAGSTSWERCCLGLPTLIFVLAENQQEGSVALQRAGAAILLRNSDEIPSVIHELLAGQKLIKLHTMGKAAAAIADGDGVNRIIARM